MREILKSVGGVLMGNWLVDWCCVVPGTSVGNMTLRNGCAEVLFYRDSTRWKRRLIRCSKKKKGLWHICLLFDALIIVWMDKIRSWNAFL